MTDWIGDPDLTAEQKLARFEALSPELTRGPLPGEGQVVLPAATFGGDYIVRDPVRISGSEAVVEPAHAHAS